METAMNNPDHAFELMVREIHSLGQFLAHKKYRYLRWAYTTFLTGLISSGAILAILSIMGYVKSDAGFFG